LFKYNRDSGYVDDKLNQINMKFTPCITKYWKIQTRSSKANRWF
jgi:hypothetical protein